MTRTTSGSAGASAACRGLARWPPDCPARTVPQPPQHVRDLEHYLDVFSHKPGAFAGSKPLAQWRAAGRWPACYDALWDRLQARHGKQNGTRAMVEGLGLGREFGHDALRTAIAATVSLGACDVAAVRYLLTEAGLRKARAVPIDVGVLA